MELRNNWIIKLVNEVEDYKKYVELLKEKNARTNEKMLMGLLFCLPVVALAYFQGWGYLLALPVAYVVGCIVSGASVERKLLEAAELAKLAKAKKQYTHSVLREVEKMSLKHPVGFGKIAINEIVNLCQDAIKQAEVLQVPLNKNFSADFRQFKLIGEAMSEAEAQRYLVGGGQEFFERHLNWMVKLSKIEVKGNNPLNAEDDFHDKNHNPIGGYNH